jgi:hypothetical protein
MIKTKTRQFNISSKNSNNGSYKSDVTVSLPDLHFNERDITNVTFSVDHCEVCNSYYLINENNNDIVINSIVYSIPYGNYNVNTFITTLLSVIPSGFNISYSSITNRLTFSYSTNFTINASSSLCTINNIIGLGKINLTSVLNSLTLPFVVNFLPLARINFRSTFFKFNNYSTSDNSTDIFLSLQNNAGPIAPIYYVNQTNIKFIINDLNITVINITVTDDNSNLINFNNVDWYMTFTINVDYKDLNDPNNSFLNILNNNSINYQYE